MSILSKVLSSKVFWAAFIVLAILAFVYFTGISVGRGKVPKHKKLPTGRSGISLGFDPAVYGAELFNVMDGFWQSAYDKEVVFGRSKGLSDDELVAVYNWFNTEYASKNSGTLTAWIRSEIMVMAPERDDLLDRMARLKLV